jgi:DNA-binding transcriptional LysR family regulator
MNLTLLQTFVAVADARSFTAAAKKLGVPTSSASRAVSRLEGDLGTKLFERTTRRTTLSAAGRAYVESARQALALLEDGETRVAELLGQPRGEVTITIPINLDGGFLARRLVEFSHRYPQVRLNVVPTNRWVDLGEEGFDLALRIQQQREGSPLLLKELGSFHAWLVASPSYLDEHPAPRHPRDLVRHRVVNMASYRTTLRLIGPRSTEVVEVAGDVMANDMHFARQLVEQGAGIGPFVFSPGDRPTLGRQLVRVLPDYVVEGPKLYVATASRRSQPLRVRLLRDFLIDAYATA